MKVLLINGSPKQDGCTKRALNEMKKIFLQEGIEVQEFDIGTNQIRGCVDCKTCYKTGKCAFRIFLRDLKWERVLLVVEGREILLITILLINILVYLKCQ